MKLGKVETHECYTTAEVSVGGCDPIKVTSIYIPHARSKADDTAPLEHLVKQSLGSGDYITAGDLNWTGSYTMQASLNAEIDDTKMIGAKAVPDDHDWNIYVQLSSEWRIATPKASDWATRTCWRTCARQRLDYILGRGNVDLSSYDIDSAAKCPGIHTDHDMLTCRARVTRTRTAAAPLPRRSMNQIYQEDWCSQAGIMMQSAEEDPNAKMLQWDAAFKGLGMEKSSGEESELREEGEPATYHRCHTVSELHARNQSLRQSIVHLRGRAMQAADAGERAALRRKSARLRRRLCRTGAVRRAWLGARARRLQGGIRAEWPTVRGRELRDPTEVVDSLAAMLERQHGLQAIGAVDPELLAHVIDSTLEAARRDGAARRSLISVEV